VQRTNRGELQLSLDGGPPALEVTHDFGPVPLGQARSLVVTATNVGKDTLTLTRLTLEGSDTGSFFVRGELGDVSPNATTTATVTFAPARVGSQATRLVFEHDADAPRPAANVSGTGQ
jgi:hypothetical protein